MTIWRCWRRRPASSICRMRGRWACSSEKQGARDLTKAVHVQPTNASELNKQEAWLRDEHRRGTSLSFFNFRPVRFASSVTVIQSRLHRRDFSWDAHARWGPLLTWSRFSEQTSTLYVATYLAWLTSKRSFSFCHWSSLTLDWNSPWFNICFRIRRYSAASSIKYFEFSCQTNMNGAVSLLQRKNGMVKYSIERQSLWHSRALHQNVTTLSSSSGPLYL